MAKALKKSDYSDLLILIFKYSKYNKAKSELLFSYVAKQLFKLGYNNMYLNKLAIDLDLVDCNKDFEIIQDNINKNVILDESFNMYDVINIKSLVWDILHKGYYE